MKDIKSVAIVGMGALGLLYGNHIAEALGNDAIYYVMDPARIEKNKTIIPTINGKEVNLRKLSCEDATPVDLLIVAVKYNALVPSFETMKNCIGPDTIIMSVMNGITSEDMIAEHFGRPVKIYTVAQGMDASKLGNALTYTHMGKLHIGPASEDDTEDVDSVVKFFEDIKMPYLREADITWRMWFKFMLNVGVNQVCMAYDTPYRGVTTPGEPYDAMIAIMNEVRQIANAKGINLTEKDIETCVEIEKALDPNCTPSMGQDRIMKRPSEVEMFAGTVIKLGKQLGIPTPANEAIYKKVKEIEAEY